ncbi:aminopeptidase 2 [Fusarium phyllophilum]|uniref:Aminopeptidase 2 n=1 Tax=Fusarium phyllophilum TaxID=47803 RepID=A0A8H5K6B5_9HYPO|nr:aminopeptidase 2 [Fusarium phyllophilum]
MEKKERILLPASVKPVSFKIALDPNFDDEKFEGHVKISCTVIRTCSYLELHCKSIKVNEARVKFKNDSWDVLGTLRWQGYNEARETLKVELLQEISPGDPNELKIILSYTGKFRADLTGLYQASYETDDGVKHRIAATAMEPTYAREARVFSCFDEPSMKAEFTLSVVVDESFVTVSNMPVERSVTLEHSSQKIVTFQKSVSMSTYHLGLVAGPLAEVKCAKGRIPISVFCPLDTEEQATFAVDLAAKGLQFFEDCFDLPYPLPKLDLIGVPEFSTGAMENWGAIIFRTTNLLLDPEDSALDTKSRELRRLSFMRSPICGSGTCWHFWDSYVANTLQKALSLDSLASSHPVELLISDPTDAKQIYDEISYKKGSCLLRMVLNNLGDTKFFDGLNLYLRRHQFQCTESDDLWKAWEEVTGEVMAASMGVWTKEAGFPVVRVSESRDESGKVTGVRLFQQRFLSIGVATEEDAASDTIYPLRFVIRQRQGVETIDMNTRELVLPPSDGLFKVNADHDSFFRTSYSHELLTRILEEASKGNLSLRDCIGLSCDLKALVAAGVNKTSELLGLNVKFAELDSFYVWEMIDRNLRSIVSVYKFHGPELNEALRKLTSDVIGHQAEELGWNISKDNDENLITLKTSMFSGAGLAGHPRVVSAAKELFGKRMAGDENAIPGSLQWEVFGIVAAHSDLEELQGLIDLWKNSSNEDEQYLALECLGRAPNAELIKWVLSHLLTDTVKNHDMFYLTWLAGGTAHGAIELWEWTKQNWERVEKEVPVDIASLFLGTALEGLHTQEQIEDVRAFFGGRDTKSYQMVLDQNLEGMESRKTWAERDISNVHSWLEGHGYLPHQSNRRLATMPPQPHSVLMHLLQSGEYSDFILRCKDREFKLHQMIVCPQSPVISAALNSGFEETTSKIITVNEFDVRTVQYMVGFLYSADYRLAPEPEKKPAQGEKREEGEIVSDDDKMSKDPSRKIADQTVYQIVSHLRVNAIADYYGIEKLAKLSTSKIEIILKKEVDFHIIPQVIAEMSAANRHLEIRSVIATATARYIAELASTQALRTIDLEHQLTIEILEACGKRVQKLLEHFSAVHNQHEQIIHKLEGDRDVTATKVRAIIQQLKNTPKCRNCKKDFWCWIEEPTNVLVESSRYALRCRGCQYRHPPN